MRKIKLFGVISLAFFSLACMGAGAAASLDAESPVGTSPTLTNVPTAGAATLAPTLALDAEGLRCAVVVAIESLHLRGGASENDIVLTWLKNGVVVEVVDKIDPDWWRVKLGDLEGFARSIYLEPVRCDDVNN